MKDIFVGYCEWIYLHVSGIVVVIKKKVKIIHFIGTKYLHELESFMQGVPGFSAKGHGGIILKKEMEDCIRGQPHQIIMRKCCLEESNLICIFAVS